MTKITLTKAEAELLAQDIRKSAREQEGKRAAEFMAAPERVEECRRVAEIIAQLPEWAKRNMYTQPPEKLREAFERAIKMVEEQPAIAMRNKVQKAQPQIDFNKGVKEIVEHLVQSSKEENKTEELPPPKGYTGCKNCHGTGEVEDNGPKACPCCGGNGWIDL